MFLRPPARGGGRYFFLEGFFLEAPRIIHGDKVVTLECHQSVAPRETEGLATSSVTPNLTSPRQRLATTCLLRKCKAHSRSILAKRWPVSDQISVQKHPALGNTAFTGHTQ